MTHKINILAFAISFLLLTLSCNKEEDPSKPLVTISELGLENSKTAYVGDDLHVEAEIVAEARIDKVEIEIHPEEATGETWEYDSVYTEFSGVKNTTFHKHVDISENAAAGAYHFHFIVTDMDGNQTAVEDDITIAVPDDSIAPEISVSSAPVNGAVFKTGETITISGTVSDNIKLGGLYIGLVRVTQGLEDSVADAANTITLLHTHEFGEGPSYEFSANIVVGAAKDNNITPKDITGNIAWQSADYYILVKSKDAFGGNWGYSAHFPVKINYE